MTLTTHAVVGAAFVSIMPAHPMLGVVLAFASHFIIDAIPHWDYPIDSASINPHFGTKMKYNKALVLDALRIGIDAILGVLISILVFASPQTLAVVFLGACMGILPDPLQFVYTRFRHEPLMSLQRFHQWIHTDNHLENAKLFGVFSQVLFVVAIITAVKLFA